MNEISNNSFNIVTPLIESKILTDLSKTGDDSTHVYLKLENIQPSGSFKIRGIGNHILAKVFLTSLF
jgi:L-serine/L-threonine ammonia-lyase